MTTPSPPAGWYADQSNPQLLRWWDGNIWTQHTQPNTHAPQPQQMQQAQPPAPTRQPAAQGAGPQGAQVPAEQAPRDTLSEALGVSPMNQQPTGDLYTAPVVIVNQKDNIVQVSENFDLLDNKGTKLGAIRQVDKNKFMKAFRIMTDMGKEVTKHFEVRDASGNVVLTIQAPNKFIGARFIVSRPDGSQIGEINSGKMFKGPMLSIVANGSPIGAVNFGDFAYAKQGLDKYESIKHDLRSGETLKRHAITDHADKVVAFIEKRSFHDLGLREGLNTSDSYVMERPTPLSEPLASLVVAAPLALDMYLHDEQRSGK